MDSEAEDFLEADNIVIATGSIPNHSLFKFLKRRNLRVYEVEIVIKHQGYTKLFLEVLRQD